LPLGPLVSHTRGMDLFATAERLMRLDADVWARHANPWSVYSRFTTLPLIALAVWSRAWIGPWALLAVAVALAWVWINPRLFPPPARHDTWAARGVRGERLWLDRANNPVPAHHVAWAHGLSAASAAGLPFLAHGLWTYDLAAVGFGLALAMGGKAWFFDRMVWLSDEMARADPA